MHEGLRARVDAVARDGVRASVNYATEKATVTRTSAVSTEQILAAVTAIGYTATLPEPPAAPGVGTDPDGDPDSQDASVRTLRNRFTDTWTGREGQLSDAPEASTALEEARSRGDYDVDHVYAGQSVGLVREVRPAGEVVSALTADAERLLTRW